MIGRIIKDLPPKEGNPRNSEGSFLKLKDSTIIFAYSKFLGDDCSDDAKACIAFLYSYDSGETFQDEKIMFVPEEKQAKNIMSVSLLRLKDCIAVFYIVRYGFHDARLHIRKSFDEGKTFTELKCCILYPGYYVTNNDRVLQLSNGRIIIPVSFHRCLNSNYNHWTSIDLRGIVRFFISDDEGETFIESKGMGSLNLSDNDSGLQEPGIIELENGHLLCYSRTDLGCQYLSHSYDFGDSWSECLPSRFFAPLSPMSMKWIDSQSVLAVYNPVPITPVVNEGFAWGRTPLIGAVSRDKGKTFTEFFEIESDRNAGYCYTAILENEDYILLAYCCGGVEDGICLNRLRIRKIDKNDIMKNLVNSKIMIRT
ncbi:MAG: exo-alpha-sialidase [Clostridia bacterium]|nr:exo-alpha-sialidase [Clostridia bacterium]